MSLCVCVCYSQSFVAITTSQYAHTHTHTHVYCRMKSDVLNNISFPGKQEQVLFCSLTETQVKYYQEFLRSDEVSSILDGKRNVLYGIDVLRKIANHPHILKLKQHNQEEKQYQHQHLITSSSNQKRGRKRRKSTDNRSHQDQDEGYDSDLAEQYYGGGGGVVVGIGGSSKQLDDYDGFEYGDYRLSGKLVVLHQLLPLWQQQGHKVLLFCQTRQMLDIIEAFITKHHQQRTSISNNNEDSTSNNNNNRGEVMQYLRMDGNTAVKARMSLVEEFNNNKQIFLFLLTTKVGGLGLNLVAANRVIIFDPGAYHFTVLTKTNNNYYTTCF